MRLSSASMVRASVPFCSMITSPAPLRSIFVKPETVRDSLTTFPEPVVTEQAVSMATVATRTTKERQRPIRSSIERIRDLVLPYHGVAQSGSRIGTFQGDIYKPRILSLGRHPGRFGSRCIDKAMDLTRLSMRLANAGDRPGHRSDQLVGAGYERPVDRLLARDPLACDRSPAAVLHTVRTTSALLEFKQLAARHSAERCLPAPALGPGPRSGRTSAGAVEPVSEGYGPDRFMVRLRE